MKDTPPKTPAETLFRHQPARIKKLQKDGAKAIREKARKEWWRNYGGSK